MIIDKINQICWKYNIKKGYHMKVITVKKLTPVKTHKKKKKYK